MDASWTISELCERVASALADAAEPPGGKARAVPDERAVRYYTTLGLLDRATLRGRTAYYGARHLAQLVAIKRLQQQGASLADIQHRLPALDDAALTALTGVALAAPARPVARRDFWRTPPVAPADAPEPSQGPTGSAGLMPSNGGEPASATAIAEPALAESASAAAPLPASTSPLPPSPSSPSFTAAHVLELAPGVRLAISASRVPTDADADAVRTAAAALVAELVRRHLVTIDPE